MDAGPDVIIERPHHITEPRCIRIGARTFIHKNALMCPIRAHAGTTYSPKIDIGSDVYIGPGLFLACVSRVVIGDGSVLSADVFINDNTHGFDPEAGLIMRQRLVFGGDVIIGKSCFIGLRAAVMPGVTLGDHCIVGVNSVVTTSFPSYCMVGGSPARILRRYDMSRRTWLRVGETDP